MAEEEGPQVKVEYLDGEEGETYNWAKRPGKVRVTYADGSTFEGTLNEERLKHGRGLYEWKKAGEEGEEPVVRATYEGEYSNGKKQGLGKMVYPNGDIYQGEWKDDKVSLRLDIILMVAEALAILMPCFFCHQMSGEGTYIYKKSSDIFSGTWVEGVKNGQGSYQFGADKAVLKGTWVNGTITTGQWIFADGTVYTGTFQHGKPVGPGSFALSNSISQSGEYVVSSEVEGEEQEEVVEPKITWHGQSVVVV